MYCNDGANQNRLHLIRNGDANQIICLMHAHAPEGHGDTKNIGLNVANMNKGDWFSLWTAGFHCYAYHGVHHTQVTAIFLG